MINTDVTEKSAAVAEHDARKKPAKSKAKSSAPKKTKKPSKPAAPRAGGKGAKILGLIGRAKGATLGELMKTTGWQAHSVRGFLSTAGKKHGIRIDSTKSESGHRVYRVTK